MMLGTFAGSTVALRDARSRRRTPRRTQSSGTIASMAASAGCIAGSSTVPATPHHLPGLNVAAIMIAAP